MRSFLRYAGVAVATVMAALLLGAVNWRANVSVEYAKLGRRAGERMSAWSTRSWVGGRMSAWSTRSWAVWRTMFVG